MDALHAKLIAMAKEVRKKAYCPYSRFAVGAALLGESGAIYTGCNVENAVYGTTWCAERTAVGTAVANGERRFRAIAVIADSPGVCTPCGTCRQTLAEFGPDIEVIMANLRGDVKVMTLSELLPETFGRDSLERAEERS